MSKIEKARPTAATVGQAQSGQVRHTFRDYSTPNLSAGQLLISDFLSTGQNNAVNLRYLQGVTGLKGREIRRMIQQERLRGIPICADNVAGYYLPANEYEKLHCARSMHHRAAEIDATANAIETASILGR